ncbi:hypothetical protein MA16_Dca000987 [Dendrobium catenatum]|uniref:Uncharacterized protein n=1 Tax=Dendrobium catenatum TaxID=906689 RepID=A0A2I0WL44_9ASPA|nr:hypothetical protein MA16_Dca000987 [Dendrobium catenatum]
MFDFAPWMNFSSRRIGSCNILIGSNDGSLLVVKESPPRGSFVDVRLRSLDDDVGSERRALSRTSGLQQDVGIERWTLRQWCNENPARLRWWSGEVPAVVRRGSCGGPAGLLRWFGGSPAAVEEELPPSLPPSLLASLAWPLSCEE